MNGQWDLKSLPLPSLLGPAFITCSHLNLNPVHWLIETLAALNKNPSVMDRSESAYSLAARHAGCWLGRVYCPVSIIWDMWDGRVVDMGQADCRSSSWRPKQEVKSEMKITDTLINSTPGKLKSWSESSDPWTWVQACWVCLWVSWTLDPSQMTHKIETTLVSLWVSQLDSGPESSLP